MDEVDQFALGRDLSVSLSVLAHDTGGCASMWFNTSKEAHGPLGTGAHRINCPDRHLPDEEVILLRWPFQGPGSAHSRPPAGRASSSTRCQLGLQHDDMWRVIQRHTACVFSLVPESMPAQSAQVVIASSAHATPGMSIDPAGQLSGALPQFARGISRQSFGSPAPARHSPTTARPAPAGFPGAAAVGSRLDSSRRTARRSTALPPLRYAGSKIRRTKAIRLPSGARDRRRGRQCFSMSQAFGPTGPQCIVGEIPISRRAEANQRSRSGG